MLTTIIGTFVQWQPSTDDKPKHKYLYLQTANGLAKIKVARPLRPFLQQVLLPGVELSMQVRHIDRAAKAVSVVVSPHQPIPRSAPPEIAKIQVCKSGNCRKRGSGKICAALQAMLQDQPWQQTVVVEEVSCLKECKQAPTIRLKPSGQVYHYTSPQAVVQLMR